MKPKKRLFALPGIMLMAVLLISLPGLALASGTTEGENPTYLPLIWLQNAPPTPTRTPPYPPVNKPPLYSNSYYFYVPSTGNPQKEAYDEGCKLGTRDLQLPGKQDSIVILDFGAPKFISGKYGASMMARNGFGDLDTIAKVSQQFGYGYWYCVGSDFDSRVKIGIGTNNLSSTTYAAVNYGHGQAWAQMVNIVNDWFLNFCPNRCDGQVEAVGANDIELAWSSAEKAIDWLNGYASATLSPLYNFGAIGGCPYFASPGAQCGGGGYLWSKEEVWRVTGSGPVEALPEIYLNNGINAQQWYLMSVYAAQEKGIPLDFVGVMTQYQACQQVSDSACAQMDNTAEQGWTQLHNLVNGDPRTAWPIRYSTDILWLN